MFDIQHQSAANGGSFVLSVDGQRAGNLDYLNLAPHLVDLTHTGVDPAYEGRGYGRALVYAAATWAQTEGHRLRASCPYALKTLQRHDTYRDLLAP